MVVLDCGAKLTVLERTVPQQFIFDCPECDTVVTVGTEIRAEILEHGCILCETAVSADAFSQPEKHQRG
ncbi:DUF7560 family zinc ribbon protein [Halogeometricum borinquense]|uniref:DUF7560 family zinc ribbon protein n=1 Tax=Halogeometricum borinquense TaxID=60847 RepID=UPI003BB90330